MAGRTPLVELKSVQLITHNSEFVGNFAAVSLIHILDFDY